MPGYSGGASSSSSRDPWSGGGDDTGYGGYGATRFGGFAPAYASVAGGNNGSFAMPTQSEGSSGVAMTAATYAAAAVAAAVGQEVRATV